MHQTISDDTVLTVVLSTALLVILGTIIIFFLFAYQRKVYRHHEDLLKLNETFNRTLLLSKLEIREQTLDHMAKELHSNVSQLVSVININLSTLLPLPEAQETEAGIRETKSLVKMLMSEIKRLSVTLNTDHIGRIGFLQMLAVELERLSATGIFEINFEKLGVEYRLQTDREIILFRLCQEILNNILNHADASVIDVKLAFDEAFLSVTIADNGVGFDAEALAGDTTLVNSTGLHNIRNRTTQMSGSVHITSSPGNGTTINVQIPV